MDQMKNIHFRFKKTCLLCDFDDFGPESLPYKALGQRCGFLLKKHQVWMGMFLTPALQEIAFMCRKALKQGLIIEYDVKAINRYKKIVIKETKHTIWSKEQLKEVLLAETPEKK